MKSMITTAALPVLLVSSALTLAADKGPYDGAIHARQGMMSVIGFSAGTLSAMAKEKVEYNAEQASLAASNLDAAANLQVDPMWPEGSDSETEGNAKNEALPKIWEDYDGFKEHLEKLRTASAALKPEAGNGLEALQGGMNDVGKSCKGCHDEYRADDD